MDMASTHQQDRVSMNTDHKFWQKVQRGSDTECWPWLGYTKPSGHGLTSLDSIPIHASRKAWILTNGPIRGGKCVNHLPKHVCALQAICCNPAHMYLGTRSDNMVDRWTNTAPAERGGLGRPHAIDEASLERLWERRRQGATLKQCAEEFGVHVATICRYITAARKDRLSRLRTKAV
jgi:hypothetical protein